MRRSMLETSSSGTAEKYFKKLPPKHRRQVALKILELARNPEPPDSSLLHGYDDCYRADIGEYRIIYRFTPVTLFVDLIGKRNDDDIYRRFKRRNR